MSVLSAFLGDQPAEGPKTVMAEMPVVLQTPRDRAKQKSPQQRLDEFWRRFTTEAPGKGLFFLSSSPSPPPPFICPQL